MFWLQTVPKQQAKAAKTGQLSSSCVRVCVCGKRAWKVESRSDREKIKSLNKNCCLCACCAPLVGGWSSVFVGSGRFPPLWCLRLGLGFSRGSGAVAPGPLHGLPPKVGRRFARFARSAGDSDVTRYAGCCRYCYCCCGCGRSGTRFCEWTRFWK